MGAIRYTVSHSARGPAMVFNDENLKPRAMMRISKEGPVLTFLDEKEIDRLMLTFTKANGGSVDMYESGKQHSMALRASGGVNGLAIFDETGQPRATMVQRPAPVRRIELLDENSQPFRQPCPGALSRDGQVGHCFAMPVNRWRNGGAIVLK